MSEQKKKKKTTAPAKAKAPRAAARKAEPKASKARGTAPKAAKKPAPRAKAAKRSDTHAAEAGRAPRPDAVPAVKGEGGGTVDVVNAQNEKVGDLALHPEVFGVEVNDHLLYEAVKQYRASGRAGTHATKNRALVAGSGKKLWRQKGTGRARIGSIRSPLWRHGGTVFGPQPRDYSYAMPKKARTAALRSALTQRANDGGLKVIDRFAIDEPKTKVLKGLLDQLGIEGKAVLVDHEPADALVLSGRNIPGLKVMDPSQLNVYDVLDCRTLLVSQEALGKLEERLTP
jgi:large subunit ribosomal protein L4